MKYLPLLLIGFILLAHISFGQNYSCISSLEPKTYFVNPNHSLNGIRIDSTKIVNGNTVNYPFKSMRCSADFNSIDFSIDTSAPSWLGAEIVVAPDHNSYIQTKWNDTFFIKNGALLGESWIVYNDSTDIYFLGTVTSIDTMTINNMIDSVKTVSISVMQGGNVLSSDSVNGIQFSISKYNGLVKALPFYFFPFYNHQNNEFYFGYDYYVDKYGGYNNIKNTFTFDKIDYQPISTENVYNFEIGDVLMGKYLEGTSPAGDFYATEIDTITDKQTIAGETEYTMQYYIQNVNYDGVQNGLTYSYQSGTKTVSYSLDVTYSPVPPIDTLRMPEEIGNGSVEYYDPKDTSFCFTSPLYKYELISIAFESTFNNVTYKNGDGCIRRYYNSYSAQKAYDYHLVGIIKNGSMCGNNGLVGTKDIMLQSQLKIYPNPAADFINIERSDKSPDDLQVSIINVTGTTIGKWNMKTNSLTIPTQSLPQGIYFIKIADSTGSLVEKISIER